MSSTNAFAISERGALASLLACPLTQPDHVVRTSQDQGSSDSSLWALGFERHALLTASASPMNSSPDPLGCPNLMMAEAISCQSLRPEPSFAFPRFPSAVAHVASHERWTRSCVVHGLALLLTLDSPTCSFVSSFAVFFGVYTLPDYTRYVALWETGIIE